MVEVEEAPPESDEADGSVASTAKVGFFGRSERGVVLVYFALTIVVVLGMAGFAIDLGYWYFTANRLQKAADAAALAAVVFEPSNDASARATAVSQSSLNGFTQGQNTVVVSSDQTGLSSNQIRVSVKKTVPTFFVRLLGINSETLTRRAVAEFQGPTPMGSASNVLGNEPIDSRTTEWLRPDITSPAGKKPNLWLNTDAPKTAKSTGDRYESNQCSGNTEYGCSTTNQEYDPGGYIFDAKVTVTAANAGKWLSLDVYDPAYINTGETCTDATTTNMLANSWDPNDPRYQPGQTQYCSGDGTFTGTPKSTFHLYDKPYEIPPYTQGWDPASVDDGLHPECSKTFDGFNGDIKTALETNNPAVVRTAFHRWVRICDVQIPTVPGTYDYFVRVLGNADVAQGGKNRYSLRAALFDSSGGSESVTPDGTAIQLFAPGRLPLYANESTTGGATSSRFFLARILPGQGSHNLTVDFFDVGDNSQAGTLQIVPPFDAIDTKNGSAPISSFSSCTFRQVTGPLRSGTPMPSPNPEQSGSDNCTLVNVLSSNGYNGQVVEANVPIPPGYSCDPNTTEGCWVTVKFTLPANTTALDTTTWSASVDGAPVRLVK